MKTHLVTGAAGFLGSNLTGALLARGDGVIALDNFVIGTRDNLADLPQENLEIIEHDIREPLDFARGKPFDEPIDLIWNLACIASPTHYTKWPIETIEANTKGIPNVLALARATGATVLHTSSSEVYGDPTEHPQRESYWGNVNPNGAHAMYKEGKRIGETIVTMWAKQYSELDVRMVRIFNTYGPKMVLGDGRMLTAFLEQALRGEPITVHGDGTQTRSTCYVSDMVEGLIRTLDRSEATRNEIVNLGNPDEHTVQEFAEVVKRLTKSSGPIKHIAARPDDVRQRCPNIAKAAALLDWEPTVELEAGLTRTIEWMRGKIR